MSSFAHSDSSTKIKGPSFASSTPRPTQKAATGAGTPSESSTRSRGWRPSLRENANTSKTRKLIGRQPRRRLRPKANTEKRRTTGTLNTGVGCHLRLQEHNRKRTTRVPGSVRSHAGDKRSSIIITVSKVTQRVCITIQSSPST